MYYGGCGWTASASGRTTGHTPPRPFPTRSLQRVTLGSGRSSPPSTTGVGRRGAAYYADVGVTGGRRRQRRPRAGSMSSGGGTPSLRAWGGRLCRRRISGEEAARASGPQRQWPTQVAAPAPWALLSQAVPRRRHGGRQAQSAHGLALSCLAAGRPPRPPTSQATIPRLCRRQVKRGCRVGGRPGLWRAAAVGQVGVGPPTARRVAGHHGSGASGLLCGGIVPPEGRGGVG